MTLPNVRKSQAGQLIVEGVLIIVVLFAITLAVAKFFKGNDLIKNIISGPWQSLAGLIQNGVWGTPQATSPSHPNGHGRHIVITGDPAQ